MSLFENLDIMRLEVWQDLTVMSNTVDSWFSHEMWLLNCDPFIKEWEGKWWKQIPEVLAWFRLAQPNVKDKVR